MKKIFLLLFSFLCFDFFAQLNTVDSLKKSLKGESVDSIKLRLNYVLSNECDENEIEKFAQTAIDLATTLLKDPSLSASDKLRYQAHLSGAYNNLGFYKRLKGNPVYALELYEKSLFYIEQCKDSAGIILALNNIGSIYYKLGRIEQAFSYFNRCLGLQQKIKDKSSLALTLCSIGLIYDEQGQKEKTLDYFRQSLAVCIETKDKRVQARVLYQIGGVYRMAGDLDTAQYFFKECVRMQEAIGDKDYIAIALDGIANIQYQKGKIDDAITTYNKCVQLTTDLGDKQGLASAYLALGKIYLNLKDYKNAEDYGIKSLAQSKAVGYPKDIRNASELLFNIYKAQNNTKLALPMYELFIQMRDSITNIETKSAGIKSQLKYEFDKKSMAESLKNMHEQKQQAIVRSVLIGGIIFVGLFVLFFYNRYKLTQRQKNIIQQQQQITETQKTEIEYKNTLITQSIDYAKRIQDALIQSETIFEELGKEYFIFNQPKDIVSGDFLWAKKINRTLLFAVVDCTGHGVPGAFMSIVGYNLLEQSTESSPGKILETLHRNVDRSLKPKEGQRSYEGMDLLICKLDLDTNNLIFAGSKQRLCLCRDNKITEYRTENKATLELTQGPFLEREIKLLPNDIIYLFTDGYPDQKNGETGQKLFYQPFEDLLSLGSTEKLADKKKFLEDHMSNWKKNEEQTDDMLIFALKI